MTNCIRCRDSSPRGESGSSLGFWLFHRARRRGFLHSRLFIAGIYRLDPCMGTASRRWSHWHPGPGADSSSLVTYAPFMRRGAFVATLAASAIVLAGCSKDTFDVLDVTGYRLDDAHNVLKDAGFENFDDVDAIDDRTPMLDANWVVLGQSPAADGQAEKETTIRLDIAKPEDEGVRDRLPVGSPVYEEIRERDERNAAADAELERKEQERRREQQVKDEQDIQNFVDSIDPIARITQNAVSDLNNIATAIAGRETVTATDSYSLTDIKEALGLYWDQLEKAPKPINASADQAQEALKKFQQAADTLHSAEGVAAAGSIERFRQLWEAARAEYNTGLSGIYAGTTVQLPTV